MSTKVPRLPRKWFVRIEWKPQDCWVGVFWKGNVWQRDVWVCLVPMLPIHFGFVSVVEHG